MQYSQTASASTTPKRRVGRPSKQQDVRDAVASFTIRRDRICFAALTTIARRAGCSKTTARVHLRALVAAGELEEVPSPNGFRTNGYRFQVGVRRLPRPEPQPRRRRSRRSSRTERTLVPEPRPRARLKVSLTSLGSTCSRRLTPDLRRSRMPRSDAGEAVAHYVDECRRLGRPELISFKARIGVVSKEVLDNEGTIGPLLSTITQYVEEGRSNPHTLLDLYVERAIEARAAREPDFDPALRPAVRHRVRAFMDEHDGRWPTGCRHVRGSHGVQEVPDVLGYDPPPGAGWSVPRPTFNEIARALAERSGGS